MNRTLAWSLVAFGACCFALGFGLVSGFLLGQQHARQGAAPGTSGPAWPFAKPPAPVTVTAEDVARHPFWKKPVTARQIEAIAERFADPGRVGDVCVDDAGQVCDRVSASSPLPPGFSDRRIRLTGSRREGKDACYREMKGSMDDVLERERYRTKYGED